MPVDRAEIFESHRGLLFSIAYRMTGSAADSEDLVQDAYIRWQTVDMEHVVAPKAYLTTIVTRLAIDYLKSARVQRESYFGTWLPEPIVENGSADENVDLADSLSMAFLLMLERLNPTERAAFLLKEVFGFSYAEIAEVVEKSEGNCRQIVRRAKEHLAEDKPRFEVSMDDQRELAERFLMACAAADADAILACLADDAILYSDGGGKVLSAVNPIYGAVRVSRFFAGIVSKEGDIDRDATFQRINGRVGCIIRLNGKLDGVFVFDGDGERLSRIYVVRNPDKLSRLQGD